MNNEKDNNNSDIRISNGMETSNETGDITDHETPEEQAVKEPRTFSDQYMPSIAILVAGIMVSGALIYNARNPSLQVKATKTSNSQKSAQQVSTEEEAVLPSSGVTLPITWGDLGSKLVSVGAIDADKFQAVYEQRGTFSEEYKNLLLGESSGKLKITNENAGYLLNLFWALGLASKNPILENGEMVNHAYGGAANFASTGGWTIAVGNTMDHYSKHRFFNLTADQQALVDKVSKGIYRPCCGNSTHFPDCNHGMAMLGFLGVAASQGGDRKSAGKGKRGNSGGR